MGNLYSKIGEMDFDGLISGTEPPVQVAARTIEKLGTAATFKRGTVMEKDAAGKLHPLGTNPSAVVTEDFNGDGSATTFTLTATVKPLYIKGVKVGTTDATVASYNAQTGVVTMSAAPTAGTKNVHISYERADASIPDCVLADDVEVGTSTDVVAAVYTGGCFNTGKLTVASGYTITEDDKDKLRMRNIVLKDEAAAL